MSTGTSALLCFQRAALSTPACLPHIILTGRCAQRFCRPGQGRLQEAAISHRNHPKGWSQAPLHVAPCEQVKLDSAQRFFKFGLVYFITQIPFYISQKLLLLFQWHCQLKSHLLAFQLHPKTHAFLCLLYSSLNTRLVVCVLVVILTATSSHQGKTVFIPLCCPSPSPPHWALWNILDFNV